MKIEKITENKIRIITNSSDLGFDSSNVHLIMNNALQEQEFFLNILDKAKKEVGFNTDGCKLLIELFSSVDDVLVFTITKYSSKKLSVRRKKINSHASNMLFKFNNFDHFCNLCEYINNNFHLNINNISKNISLYFYNNTYFLLIKDINFSYKYTKFFMCILSEFATPISFSHNFESKLLEHGKVIIKKNAITTVIRYFVLNQ